jgi:hypothetical protein
VLTVAQEASLAIRALTVCSQSSLLKEVASFFAGDVTNLVKVSSKGDSWPM